MKVIILAAGMATRLRPLTDTVPKCLLPVGGKVLLERTLAAVAPHRPEEIVIVTGFLAGMIEDFVESLSLSVPIRFIRNVDYARTNNNYSLWLALRSLGPTEFVLLDADILFDPLILTALLTAPQGDALVIRRTSDLGAEEIKIECDRGGNVVRIGKDVAPPRAAGESLGIEKFSRPVFERLLGVLERRKDTNEFYEASFQEMIDDGVRIVTVDSGPRICIEIDTPDDLKRAEAAVSGIRGE